MLVVDDDMRIVRFVKMSLEVRGYDITTAASGEEALRVVERDSPDIMLLDVIMPGIDGFEVMRRLRVRSTVPVIAWSADSSKADEMLRLGASIFFPKSVDPDVLLDTIGEVLGAPTIR